MTRPPLPDEHGILDRGNRRTLLEFAANLRPAMEEQTHRSLGLRHADIITSRGFRYLGTYDPSTVSIAVKKKMRKDPQVTLALAAAKAPMRTTTFEAKCASNELKALVEGALVDRLRSPMLKHHGMAVDFGHQTDELLWAREPVEFAWEPEEGGDSRSATRNVFLVQTLKDLDPQDYRYVMDEMGRLVGITQRGIISTSLDKLPILVELQKLAHHVEAGEFGDPHGIGRTERMYPPWYWETVVYLLTNQYMERRAVPAHVLYADPADAPKDPITGNRSSNALQSIALRYQRLIRSQAVVAVWSKFNRESKERMWDLKVLQDEARTAQFLEYLQHLDLKIMRAALVSERAATGNDKTGSYSQTSALQGLVVSMAKEMLDDVAATWNEQILPRFLDANGITDKVRIAHTGVAKDTTEVYTKALELLVTAEQAIAEGRATGEVEGLLMSLTDTLGLLEGLGIPTRADAGRQKRPEPNEPPETPPNLLPGTPGGGVDEGGDGQDPDEGEPKDPARRKAARLELQAVATVPSQVETEDPQGADVARLKMGDLEPVLHTFTNELEGEVARITAAQRDAVEERQDAAKAVLLLLLLMGNKVDAAGNKIPGRKDLQSLVWKDGGTVLRAPATIAANLPRIEAAARALPGGGVRLVDTGNKGLLSHALKGVKNLVGPEGLKNGLRNVGGGLRHGLESTMNLGANHYTRATRKGAWGIRANWRAILRGGWPGRDRDVPDGAPDEKKFRRRARKKLELNEEGILRNIENIGLRVLGGIIERMRNAFGNGRLLEKDPAGGFEFGLVDEVADWRLNRRNTDLTFEAHLRAAYRASWLLLAEGNGFDYFLGIHPKVGAPERGPKGGAVACRKLDGKVGTAEWWRNQGEKGNAPAPMEMFGLGWGCRIQFYPVPQATVVRSKVPVER